MSQFTVIMPGDDPGTDVSFPAEGFELSLGEPSWLTLKGEQGLVDLMLRYENVMFIVLNVQDSVDLTFDCVMEDFRDKDGLFWMTFRVADWDVYPAGDITEFGRLREVKQGWRTDEELYHVVGDGARFEVFDGVDDRDRALECV